MWVGKLNQERSGAVMMRVVCVVAVAQITQRPTEDEQYGCCFCCTGTCADCFRLCLRESRDTARALVLQQQQQQLQEEEHDEVTTFRSRRVKLKVAAEEMSVRPVIITFAANDPLYFLLLLLLLYPFFPSSSSFRLCR